MRFSYLGGKIYVQYSITQIRTLYVRQNPISIFPTIPYFGFLKFFGFTYPQKQFPLQMAWWHLQGIRIVAVRAFRQCVCRAFGNFDLGEGAKGASRWSHNPLWGCPLISQSCPLEISQTAPEAPETDKYLNTLPDYRHKYVVNDGDNRYVISLLISDNPW